jgi:hypothetical protein
MKRVSLIMATVAVALLSNFWTISAANACGHAGRFGGCLAHGHFDPTVREYADDRSSDTQRHIKPQRLPKWNSHHAVSVPHRRAPVPAKW